VTSLVDDDFGDDLDPPEPQRPHEKLLADAKRNIALAEGPLAKLKALAAGAATLEMPVKHGFIAKQDVIDELRQQALNCDMSEDPGEYVVLATISRGLKEGVADGMNGHALEVPAERNPDDPGPSPDSYGSTRIFPVAAPDISGAVLTIDDWLNRKLPEPDYLLGWLLSTTSRAMFVGDTGLGKTTFLLGMAFSIADGAPFLHWVARRPAQVLFIDGELSRIRLKQMIADEVTRFGGKPDGLHVLSYEDIEGFAPLNTPAGQACIEKIIEKIGGVDFVFFDSVMCLTVGDMKDEESWQQTLPWVRALTKRSIGQMWAHHTGHDKTRSYGTKTREWQLDLVALGTALQRDDTDLSFSLEFPKARERAPATRADFQPVSIALVNDEWQHDGAVPSQAVKVPPLAYKFLDALKNALASQEGRDANGRRSVPRAVWRAEAAALGLTDPEQNAKSANTLFNTNRRVLITANLVGSNEQNAWLI
jgi:AAA domain